MPFVGFAQNEYRASNGKTYKIGDTVKVAMGSMPDGSFKYVQASPLLPTPPSRNSNSLSARRDFAKLLPLYERSKKAHHYPALRKLYLM